MDISSDIKFEDLKKEERYKKLKNNLRFTSFKQVEQMNANNDKYYCTSPAWPNASTIHSEGADTSTANGRPYLRVSNIESDIVSSSTNLRKILPLAKNAHTNQSSMVTSSVKKFQDMDNPMMPPPLLCTRMSGNLKGQLKVNSNYNVQEVHSKNQELDDKSSNTCKRISPASTVSHKAQPGSMSSPEYYKGYRVFSRWRVIINNQGQLIIKGTLECGKVARSKPIIQRFSSNKVQSIFRHIYFLVGNIADVKCELPDYVRGKFYNGFPDDWENVYQLWRSYIAEGCPVVFRWPRRITDSDDDLNSEITDFSFFKDKKSQYKDFNYLNKHTSDNQSSLSYSSKIMLENHQKLENSKEKDINYAHRKTHVTNKKLDDSGNFSGLKYISTSNTEYVTNNSIRDVPSTDANSLKSSINNESYLHEIIREDKLKIILSNIGDKNCPSKYLDKFIELVDCLKYILSYMPENSNEMISKNRDLKPSNNQVQSCQMCNSTPSLSARETRSKIQCNIQNQNEIINLREIKENYIKSQSMDSDSNIENKSSNSDSCMGVPKLNLKHLFTSKARRSVRYKNLRNRNRGKNNANKGQHVQEKKTSVKDQKQFSDSCKSISEYEYNKSKEQKFKKQRSSYVKNIEEENSKATKVVTETESQRTNIGQNVAINKKPVITSCEPVYFNIKLKDQSKSKTTSYTCIDDNRISQKTKMLPEAENVNRNNENNENMNEENLSEEILQHPFLTYDSEDFENEEKLNMHLKNTTDQVDNRSTENDEKNVSTRNQELKLLTSEEKEMSTKIGKIGKNQLFGSKSNPKLLMSWIPCVEHDANLQNKYRLKFKGKLLNEAGHILHRKFITDAIYQRHTLKLVETVNNEYFMLIGELTNKNHVIPKEILKLCYAGCPSKINEFCEEWINFNLVNTKPTDDNKSIDDPISLIKVATSSRGRRIIPPLKYWHGERIITKDFDIVYSPGNMTEPSFIEKSEEHKKFMTMQKSNSRKSRNISADKSPKKRLKIDSKSPSPINRSQLNNSTSSISDKSFSMKNISTVKNYTQKLRTRSQVRANPIVLVSRYNTRMKASPKKHSELTWTCGRKKYTDILSEDQASIR